MTQADRNARPGRWQAGVIAWQHLKPLKLLDALASRRVIMIISTARYNFRALPCLATGRAAVTLAAGQRTTSDITTDAVAK